VLMKRNLLHEWIDLNNIPASFLRNAHAIALFLESHKGVTKVVYPGLPSHPQYELAKRQQHGFGAMITFYCVGSREQSAIVLRAVSPSEMSVYVLRHGTPHIKVSIHSTVASCILPRRVARSS